MIIWGLLWVCCDVSLSTSASEVVEAKFKRNEACDATDVIGTTEPRSRIACSVTCSQTTGCQSFTLNVTACYLLAGDSGEFDMDWTTMYQHHSTEAATTTTSVSTSTPVPITTSAICASSSGYSVRILGGNSYLVRLGDNLVIGDVARTCCEVDGAHLITIESQAMLDDVATLLTSLGHAQAQLWIDGMDTYGSDVMYTWDGKVLPFLSWSSAEPHNGDQDCIIIYYVSFPQYKYFMGDVGCASNTRLLMCQM